LVEEGGGKLTRTYRIAILEHTPAEGDKIR